MKKVLGGATIFLLLLALFFPYSMNHAEELQLAPVIVKPVESALEHRQDVWINALEWCESRGIKTAINKKDVDGTPSFFSFQFKPSTFQYYVMKYELLPATTTPALARARIGDYDLQRAIVRKMLDDKKVRWEQQFPDCVKNKIGRPPTA